MSPAVIQDLDVLKQRLAPYVQGVRKAIVFGSVARGEADEWSDLDLVIVAETSRPFLERYRDFEGIYDVWRRLDLLVYTPEEFARMQAEGRPFIDHVVREGVVIHEAQPRAEAERWLAQARSELACAAPPPDSTNSTSPRATRTVCRVVFPPRSSRKSRRPRPSPRPRGSSSAPRT